MRQKEQSSLALGTEWAGILRLQRYAISDPNQISLTARQHFSGMKYGDPAAVAVWAQEIAAILLGHPEMQAWVAEKGGLWLSSSAYGAVPSAAAHLREAVAAALRAQGWQVHDFKIERAGGFERTNFGALDPSAREKAIRHRKIQLSEATAAQLKDQIVVILDDLRCTGSHERSILHLLMQETQVAQLAFAYCITFEGEMRAEQEELLNHAHIQHPEDLLPLFRKAEDGPLLNARLLKFILRYPVVAAKQIWPNLQPQQCLALYAAATSTDGYFDMPRFRAGFASLENWLFAKGLLPKRHSYALRAAASQKVVGQHIRELRTGQFVCAETDADLSEAIQLYSRFKFGDVAATAQLVEGLTDAMVSALEVGGSLRAVFERAAQRQEYISLTAPGVRNVISASNMLAREVGLRVNAWLSLQGLPTMVIRTLGRLGSGRANYAALSAKDRSSHSKTTQTLIPKSEYQQFPSHVIFLDDVEVTGQTGNRARSNSLRAGALSFHAVFAFKVDPAQATADAGIEHRLNQFVVQGSLDAEVARILQHPDYQPVQRMLRLLLHPNNRAELPEFLATQVSDRILQRLYLGAMSNDYLWIHAAEKGMEGEYAGAVRILQAAMQARNLIDARGIVRLADARY